MGEPMEGVIVETASGKVRGRSTGGALVFKGIPYGSSPTGRGRFLPASPARRWPDIVDATEFGPACPQPVFSLDGELERLLPTGAEQVQGEDCLVLNVWTPAIEAPARPVMVWAHGGAYTVG